VAVGDLNQDGQLELVVASQVVPSLSQVGWAKRFLFGPPFRLGWGIFGGQR